MLVAFTSLRIQFPAKKTQSDGSTPLKDIAEGIKYSIKNQGTRTFPLMEIILPLLTIPILTILSPIYAVEVFNDESGRILGILMGSVGVGGIIGGLIVASFGRFENRGRLQLISLFLCSLSLIGFALSSSLLLSLMLLAISGLFEMIFLTTNQTLIQLSILDHMRGRITAISNLNAVITPLGGMIAGVGSDLLGGPRPITIITSGLAAAISVIVFIMFPTVRNYRLSKAIE